MTCGGCSAIRGPPCTPWLNLRRHSCLRTWCVWWDSLVDTAGDPETWEIDMEAPEVREELHPLLARDARTDQFLTDRGMSLSQKGRDSFLSAVVGEFLEATKTLQRRGSGKGRRNSNPDVGGS